MKDIFNTQTNFFHKRFFGITNNFTNELELISQKGKLYKKINNKLTNI